MHVTWCAAARVLADAILTPLFVKGAVLERLGRVGVGRHLVALVVQQRQGQVQQRQRVSVRSAAALRLPRARCADAAHYVVLQASHPLQAPCD